MPVIAAILLGVWPFATSMAASGKVVDAATGEPLADVLGNWSGFQMRPAHGLTVCYHLDVVKTKADGTYYLPWSWEMNPLITDRVLTVAFYKADYRAVNVDESDAKRILLQRDDRPLIDHFSEIGTVLDAAECGSHEEKIAKALPLYREIYDETRQKAHTPNERYRVISILAGIDTLELGLEQAAKNQTRRMMNEATKK